MKESKQAIRATLRNEYAALDSIYKADADEKLIQRVKNLSIYKNSNRIFLFASVNNEVNTHDLICDSYADGKSVYLPKCYSKGIMEFYKYTGELTEGRFGIPQPTGDETGTPLSADLMIVPGLAFTKDGRRLGQGGGFYDRYLQKHPCITVGLCRDVFLKKELPIEWNDLPVDYVITETSVYECKNGAS